MREMGKTEMDTTVLLLFKKTILTLCQALCLAGEVQGKKITRVSLWTIPTSTVGCKVGAGRIFQGGGGQRQL